MRVGGAHLGYCTNVHPGESWAEIDASLRLHLPEVKRHAAPHEPFGVGLRLSARAAEELEAPGAIDAFLAFLRSNDLYVFTLNGFPFGDFHGTPVKESVYRPDWSDTARLDYTLRLARLLATLAPAGGLREASISTLPGTFKAFVSSSSEGASRIADALVACAAGLVDIERKTGCRITLALEPEPCCLLETIDETVQFFTERLYSPAAVAEMARLSGLDAASAAEALRRHLGVCLDLCHAAVEFEDPAECVEALRRAGIPIAKVQVSAGLRLSRVSEAAVASLATLADGVYLHQVVEKHGEALVRYADIDAASTAGRWREADVEWRVHFHVPVFRESLAGFQSTRAFVEEALTLHRHSPLSSHLEVETYTWTVLPEHERAASLDEAIARELCWTRERAA